MQKKQMTEKQIAWTHKMYQNIAELQAQYQDRGIDKKLRDTTERQIFEATRRLKLVVIDEEEFAADNEFWDGEADCRTEWLEEHMRVITSNFADPFRDEDDYFDEEALYEKEQDRQYFLRHGNDPWWAQ